MARHHGLYIPLYPKTENNKFLKKECVFITWYYRCTIGRFKLDWSDIVAGSVYHGSGGVQTTTVIF